MLLARFSLLALLVPFVSAAPSAAAEQHAYVVTSDFSTGALSKVNLDTHAVIKDCALVHSDATLRYYEGRIYVVNRFGQDNLQVIDSSGCATVRQFSVGPGSNPQDVAIVSATKCYVSRYDVPELAIYNPASGASLGTISLASFADADGIPEMAHLALVGHRLFVAVQRLDRNAGFVPTAYSLVVVVDTQADTVIDVDPVTPGTQAIQLVRKNPVTTFSYDRASNRLLVGCAGRYGALDGGIEAIDPVALTSLGVLTSEAKLGGDIGDVEWWSATHSYAIVTDLTGNSQLVSWNPTTGNKIGILYNPGGFSVSDCAVNDRNEIYVGDNGFVSPGLYVFSAGSDVQVAGPLDCGLPPNQITFDQARDEVASVAPQVPDPALALPRPNPARDAVTFAITLARAADVRIEAFDISGRRVRVLAEGLQPAGVHELTWDLADRDGRRVDAGVYVVRAAFGGRTVCRRIAVIH